MGYRVPAPDGLKARDGRPVLVLPEGTVLKGLYRVSYLTAGGMSVAYTGIRGTERYFVKEVEASNSQRVIALTQERFMLDRLNHPGIVKPVDFFEYDGFYYLIMDFVDGSSLDRMITTNPFLTEERVLAWALQLYDIFEYLHKRKPPVIYRDLKPHNVIVDRQGKLHLIDFGIARVFKESQKSDTYSMGSALTASPEHYGGRQTDERSDIFTLAATFHYLLTGGLCQRHELFEFPPVREINPLVSRGLEKVLQKALSVAPEERYKTVDDMRKAHIAATRSAEDSPLLSLRNVETVVMTKSAPQASMQDSIKNLIPLVCGSLAAFIIIVCILLLFRGVNEPRATTKATHAGIAYVTPSESPSSPVPTTEAPVATVTVVSTVSVTVPAPSRPAAETRITELPGLPSTQAPVRKPSVPSAEALKTIVAPALPLPDHPVMQNSNHSRTSEPLPKPDFIQPAGFTRIHFAEHRDCVDQAYGYANLNDPYDKSIRFIFIRIARIDYERPPSYYFSDLVGEASSSGITVPVELLGDRISAPVYRGKAPGKQMEVEELLVVKPVREHDVIVVIITGAQMGKLKEYEEEFLSFYKSFSLAYSR